MAPGDLVRSYLRQNEAALLEASGREFLSKSSGGRRRRGDLAGGVRGPGGAFAR